MDGFWIRALEEAEAAERRAQALRDRFGQDAEAHCSDQAPAGADGPPPREQDVRKALRWT